MEMLGTMEAAKVLGIPRYTLWALIKKGLIKSYRPAGRFFVAREDLDAYLAKAHETAPLTVAPCSVEDFISLYDITVNNTHRIKSKDLYASYLTWCESKGERFPVSHSLFSPNVVNLGVPKVRHRHGVQFVGIRKK